MPRQVLMEAYSIEEARQRAARLFHHDAQRAQAEVLQPGRSGLFGMGRRPGLIRIVFSHQNNEADDLPRHRPDPRMPPQVDAVTSDQEPAAAGAMQDVEALRQDGVFDADQALVEVRDGELVIHAGAVEKPARLKVGEGVQLLVNDKEIHEEISVTGSETLMVKVIDRKSSSNDRGAGFTIEVAEDGMTAGVWFHFKHRYRLQDALPTDRLRLERTELRVLPSDVTTDNLQAALAEAGVCYGIDQDALSTCVGHALKNPDDDWIVLARGTPPDKGVPGRLEWFVEMERQHSNVSDHDGRIDFRERPELPSVTPDQVLAHVHPSEPGQAGRDVRGMEVLPDEAPSVRLLMGKGVRKEDAQKGPDRLLAARQGRPVAQEGRYGFWRINVLPTLVHQGDVDMASGNLTFDGDVEVRGNVTEGMRVVATGNIRVLGEVSGAVLLADGNVEVRGNVFQGHLVAGYHTLLYGRVEGLLRTFESMLADLQAAETQLQDAAQDRGRLMDRLVARSLPQLIKMKFSKLPILAEKLLAAARTEENQGQIDAELMPLARALEPLTSGSPGPGFDVRAACRITRTVLQRATFHYGMDADAQLAHAHNTKVWATRDIVVFNRGTYHSRLISGRRIQLYGPAVGGLLEASEAIKVRESGSESGASTLLRVGLTGNIHIGVAHPRTRLEVGGRFRVLESQRKNVRVTASGRKMALT